METTLFSSTDKLIGIDYRLVRINAITLSNKLKSTLSSMDINYNDYIIDDVNVKLPNSVYEYQNFFLIEDNGEYLLLDGFRRLLWNTEVPNIDIHVRVYNKSHLNDSDILNLIIELNQQKFTGGMGLFFDRGFSLCMKMFFNIDLKKISDLFTGYIKHGKDTYEYFSTSYSSDDTYKSCKKQLLNKNFVSDMKFLMGIAESNKFICDVNFGAMVKIVRNQNNDIVFDARDFIEKIESNKYIMESIEKQRKSNDSRGDVIGNMLIEHYKKVLSNNTELTFIEREESAKYLLKKLKANKKLVVYTNSSRITNTRTRDKNDDLIEVKGIIEEVLEFHSKNGRYPSVKVLIFPDEKSDIKDGLYDDFYIHDISDIKQHTGYGAQSVIKKKLVVKNNNGLELGTKFFSSKVNDLNVVNKINKSYLFIDELV